MFEKHTSTFYSIKLFKEKGNHTCLVHIYHFVQQSFVWKMSVISKNKVPADGGGENRHMFQLFLIFFSGGVGAAVKMKVHTLKELSLSLNMSSSKWSLTKLCVF